MGKLAKLFKPSPEQIKAREDAARAKSLIEQREWHQLEKIGKPAVKPLIKALARTSKSHDLESEVGVVQTLGRIGKAEAIEHFDITFRCVCTDDVGHEYVDWDRYRTLTPVVAEALTAIGKTHLEQILKHFKKWESGAFLLHGIPIVWALCGINDKRAVEPTVNWLISVGQGPLIVPGSLGRVLFYGKRLLSPSDIVREFVPDTAIVGFLGDYGHLILDALAWQLASYSEDSGEFKFHLGRCAAAVSRLCDIKTPISNNVLLKLSQIERLNVAFFPGTHESRTEYIDFGEISWRAMQELKSRGKPCYDPEAYLDQNAWTL